MVMIQFFATAMVSIFCVFLFCTCESQKIWILYQNCFF